MHDPYYAQPDIPSVDPRSSSELMAPDMMLPNTGHINGDAGLSARRSDSSVRYHFQNDAGPRKIDEFNSRSLDPEIMELYYRSRMQEEEIMHLRKEVTDAGLKELHLLNEKHILERKLCELRIALDEKLDDSITSALKELTKKRSYFEENLRLANNLKDVEEEMYILTSSLLSFLAEYNIQTPLINSSAISYGIKKLYQHMQWKIRSYETMVPGLHLYDQYSMNSSGKSISHQKRDINDAKITRNSEMAYPLFSERPRDFPSDNYREADGAAARSSFEGYAPEAPFRPLNADAQFPIAPMPDQHGSEVGEFDLPSIDGFQIYGDAQPGCKLLACGYPSNGTTLCIFQWVRELDDGTRQYIDGATVPEYVVTADDVDTILAVECTPIDESGRQGDLVRQFANNQNKIACDSEMQHYIDTHISSGKAEFDVQLLMDASDWEQAVLILKRSNYLIIAKKTDQVVMEEKYSPDLKIKVPLGYSTQFVLTCSDGSNLPLSTGTSQPHLLDEDVRLRDVIVLTMRYFQTKALDAKRKVKA